MRLAPCFAPQLEGAQRLGDQFAAFVEGFAFADATGTCATARLFEVLLMEGVTDFFGADFIEPAFAGEFLIESLCFTIL